jgi:hypothetical protein
MKTGNGKVANLPSKIRDELNYRLNDGEPGNELVEWLNSKPEVVQVLKERFDGAPISEQNLSEWRKRGYQQWLLYHLILDESDTLSGNADEIAETGINCEKLLLTLTASYAEMIQRWSITPTDEMTYKIGVFKNLTNAVITLRRTEMQAVRLEIERAKLELLLEKGRNKSASSSSAKPALSLSKGSAPSSSTAPRAAENPAAESPSTGDPSSDAPPIDSPTHHPAPPEPPKPAPQPPAPPAPQLTAAPVPPAAATPPPKPKIPPYRDPRSRYSLR